VSTQISQVGDSGAGMAMGTEPTRAAARRGVIRSYPHRWVSRPWPGSKMLMRRAGIKGLPGSRKPRPTHQTPTASDLVHRDFARPVPDRLWVTDITEHPTREGKVYCAVLLDAFSRRVVGWSIDASQTAALVTSALDMAIRNRQPGTGVGILGCGHATGSVVARSEPPETPGRFDLVADFGERTVRLPVTDTAATTAA
jgi:transposase InsO family protein